MLPFPQQITTENELYQLTPAFDLKSVGYKSDVLDNAIKMYKKIIALAITPSNLEQTATFLKANGSVAELTINVHKNDNSLNIDTDESCKIHLIYW
jgi:hypothetical protein